MLLVFILFQRLDDVKEMLFWVYPEQRHFKLQEKVYAVNCSSVSVRRLWNELDVFAFGHFWGWVMKALLVRHYGICWTISVTWEMTEMAFAHLLPNFAECWWDMLILDVLLCNGLGIWVGMVICNLMEMRNYHWESIKDIHSTTGKIRRAVLQFTPASWTHVRWLDPHSSYMRVVAISVLVVVWNLSELNNFFLMEYFGHEPGDLPTLTHLFIVWLLSGPAIRQYYSYVTDTQCKRVGTQCWVFCAIIFTESLICLKFGLQIFKQTQIMYIVMWLTIQMVSCLLCVYLCAYIAKRSTQSDDIQDDFASEGTTTEEVISRPVTVPNGRTLLHQYNYKDNSFSLHATETTETTATTSDRHPLLLGHMTNGAALQYDQVSDGLTTTATENNRYNLRKRGRDGL